MDQLPLENFENSRIEFLSKISYCLFCQKLASCGENGWLWENGGVFEIFDQFLLEQLSLCLNMCVWLRDRKLSLICKKQNQLVAKNDPYMPNLRQNKFEFSFVLMLHFF
jgi:hypothetical protein